MHAFLAVATLIAIGVPFPGRLLLIAAGASTTDPLRAVTLTVAGAVGALAGDHLWYGAGRLGGRRLLAALCRLSLGSGRCLSRAREHFQRFGPFTIVLGRFVAGVRLFAAPLAGAGAISYPRYLGWDALGAVVWSGAFVGVGYVLGDRWRAIVEQVGVGPAMLIVVVLVLLATVATVGVRLWRRHRHGCAQQPGLTLAAAP